MSQKIDGDAESECVSEAGDIGDRTLLGTRHSEGDGLRLSLDSTPKNEDVYISRDHELQQHPSTLNYIYPVNPLEKFPTPVFTDRKVPTGDIKQVGSFSNFLFWFSFC